MRTLAMFGKNRRLSKAGHTLIYELGRNNINLVVTPPTNSFIINQSGGYILAQNGSKIKEQASL